MKSTLAAILVLSACAAACGWLCGCGDAIEGLENFNSSLSLQNLIQKLSGPTPKQKVAMAFDPNDADRRRMGIIGLTEKDWGLREPYLKGYAAILRTDDDPLVRSAAVRALGKARDPNYVEDVVRALFDREAFVRQDAAAALLDYPSETAIDPLRNRATDDTDEDVRANSARALRQYRTANVVVTLLTCLDDDTFTVRHEAHASLVAVTGKDMGYEARDWGGVSAQAPPPERPADGSWWDRLWQGRRKPSPQPPDRASG